MTDCSFGEVTAGMVCSILPDRVEAPLGGRRLLAHRGVSHELLVWLIPFMALRLFFPSVGLFREYSIPAEFWFTLPPALLKVLPAGLPGLNSAEIDFPLWAVPLGGVLHLLLGDVFTPGGIRLFGMDGVSFSLFNTGSLGERLYVFGFLVCTVCFHVFRHMDSHPAWIPVRLVQAVLVVSFAGFALKRRKRRLAGRRVNVQSLSGIWLKPKKVLTEKDASCGYADMEEVNGSSLAGENSKERAPDAQQPGNENPRPDSAAKSPVVAHSASYGPPASGEEDTPSTDAFTTLTSREPWKSEELWQFLVEEVHPEMDVLVRDPPLLDALAVLLRLLDKYPTAPSVYGHTDDGARLTDPETFSRLGKVPLMTHLFNTVNAGRKILLMRFGKTYRASYGKFLLAFLGHDIGKLPFFHRGRPYTKDEHCRAGAGYILDLLGKHRFAEQIARAVRKHHERSFLDKLDSLTITLIEADTEARNIELGASDRKAAVSNGPESKNCHGASLLSETGKTEPARKGYYTPELREIPDSFPMALVFEGLRNKANATHRFKPRLFVSVSQPDGWVYYHPEVVYEAIQDAAREARIQDIWFFDESFKKSILFSFHRKWEKGSLARQVGPSFFGMYYRVANTLKDRVSKAWFMALRCEALGATSSELEEERKAREATAHIKVTPWKEDS
jgi:hypothetical protein